MGAVIFWLLLAKDWEQESPKISITNHTRKNRKTKSRRLKIEGTSLRGTRPESYLVKQNSIRVEIMIKSTSLNGTVL